MQTGIWNSFNEKFHVNICTSQSTKTNLKKSRAAADDPWGPVLEIGDDDQDDETVK